MHTLSFRKIIMMALLLFSSFRPIAAQSEDGEYYIVWEDNFDSPELDETYNLDGGRKWEWRRK